MGYKINGTTLQVPGTGVPPKAATAPTSHSVAPVQPTIIKTIGGQIMVEPPSGNLRVFSWEYDQRGSAAVGLLRNYIGNNPLVVIDTYDETGEQLTNLLCTTNWPEIKSANKRDMVEAFTLQFQEVTAQS